jgi:hypothetical protein
MYLMDSLARRLQGQFTLIKLRMSCFEPMNGTYSMHISSGGSAHQQPFRLEWPMIYPLYSLAQAMYKPAEISIGPIWTVERCIGPL